MSRVEHLNAGAAHNEEVASPWINPQAVRAALSARGLPRRDGLVRSQVDREAQVFVPEVRIEPGVPAVGRKALGIAFERELRLLVERPGIEDADGLVFTITIQQTNNSSNGTPFFDIQQGNQITLYNVDCSNSSLGTLSVSNGQVSLTVAGATAGQVFVIGAKYSPKSVVGAPAPVPATVHYDFVTKVNGVAVATDPLGIDLKM